MKRTSIFQILLLVALLATGACSSTAWDELPDKITSFLSEYFPGEGIRSYTEGASAEGGDRVVTGSGVSVVFDSNYNWTEVDGNGHTLPQVFIYDQMPPALFQYLQETENDDKVYKVGRTSSTYIVTLTDSYITYDIESGEVNYPTASD